MFSFDPFVCYDIRKPQDMIYTAEYYLAFGDNDLMIVDEG
jgi:hypothetical protein